MSLLELAEALTDLLPHIAGGAAVLAALLASGHAILYKRNPRAAALWVGFIWLLPALGTLLYLGLGINRIQRRAQALRGPGHEPLANSAAASSGGDGNGLPDVPADLGPLVRLVDRLAHHPLAPGNRVDLLVEGDEAYPAMLAAIDRAERSLTLSTYIFDDDRAGEPFIAALAAAVQRGVETRVLVDGVGARYSWPPITRRLRRAGVPVARFLPALLPGYFPYLNLRNHRKILVADGRIGFTGGMNIREGCLLALSPHHPVRDLHARLEGPVVAQLQEAFAEDWAFTTGERLEGPIWFPALAPVGSVTARGLPDGPDEDLDELRLTMLGALALARSQVRIVTPYFLPDEGLVVALNVAAMRGVSVDVVLPATSNLALVQWASTAMLWQILERGCRVWLTPPPFDHAKLMVVDGAWTLLGSGNWDPRSLRLNFEFNVECYSAELAQAVDRLVGERIARARPLTLAEVDGRPLPVRLRDGIARLFTPFL